MLFAVKPKAEANDESPKIRQIIAELNSIVVANGGRPIAGEDYVHDLSMMDKYGDLKWVRLSFLTSSKQTAIWQWNISKGRVKLVVPHRKVSIPSFAKAQLLINGDRPKHSTYKRYLKIRWGEANLPPARRWNGIVSNIGQNFGFILCPGNGKKAFIPPSEIRNSLKQGATVTFIPVWDHGRLQAIDLKVA